jgi:FMN-dependent NADH-azoreductase
MKKLLHIIASPRGDESRTLQVSEAFLDEITQKYPDIAIDELNVMTAELPSLTQEAVAGKYVLLSGNELTERLKDAWKNIVRHIERFLSADGYLISTPMWNFSIPYPLKQYIDVIVQPKYLFDYTEKGPEGLVKDKKMIVITSRGGDYSPGSPAEQYDFQEPYIRTVFGFAGVTDITFINAQPIDAMGPDTGKKKLEEARDKARKAAEVF